MQFAVAVAVLALSVITSREGKRYQFPFINVVCQRILPDAQRLAWFEREGMPVPEGLMAWKYKWASSHDFALYHDPIYAEFMAWTERAGFRTYAQYLVTHPGYTIASPLRRRPGLFSANLYKYTWQPPPLLAIRWVSFLFWPPAFIAMAGAVLLVSLLRYLKQSAGPVEFAVAALVPALVVHAVLVFHADAMEISRHGLLNVVGLCTAAIVGVCASADIWYGRVRESTAGSGPGT